MSTSSADTRHRERLALLFGDEDRQCFNPIHSFVRDMLWSLLWHLNRLFGEGVTQGGVEGWRKQVSVVRLVGAMMTAAQFRYDPEKAAGGLLNLYLLNDPDKMQVLIQVANALSDARFQIIHRPMQFHPETGIPEIVSEAGERLLRETVFHPNQLVAASYPVYRDAIVRAGILNDENADQIIETALLARGQFKGEQAPASPAMA